MAKKEVYNCEIWQMRKGQIDGFDGVCIMDSVKTTRRKPCIHFMEETKLKVKTADVPIECFIARIAREIS
jgi:hypothetical protein